MALFSGLRRHPRLIGISVSFLVIRPSLSLSSTSNWKVPPQTMGENLLRSSAGPSCPCCSFLSADSLFLPPDMKSESLTSDQTENNNGDDDMLSPLEALQRITEACRDGEKEQILLVDTHGHAHLDRETQEAYTAKEDFPTVVSLTCAVSESDWPDAVSFASQSDKVLFGLGVHPWYLEDLSDTWLSDLETLLEQHPSAIVGEIGLCKVAKFVRTYKEGKTAALQLQRQVFKDQMRLAAKLQRPVSVHCVKQHGIFMSVLKEIVQEGGEKMEHIFPPAIGMHSFTGTEHHVKEILKFEKEHFPSDKLFYFGFSHSVNVAMCSSEKSRRQGREAIRAVPIDRLLAESDVHSPKDTAAGTAGAVAYLASALIQPLLNVAQATAKNGLEFLNKRRNSR